MEASRGYGGLLKNGRFEALLWTEILGAFGISSFAIASAAGRDLTTAVWAFAVPFLLFGGYAGQFADRFSKSRIVRASNSIGIAIMAAGGGALFTSRPAPALAILLLLGSNAAFASAAGYGIVWEAFGESQTARASALLLLGGLAAVVGGAWFGAFLNGEWRTEPLKAGFALVGIAVAGWIASRGIPGGQMIKTEAAESSARISWNPGQGIPRGGGWLPWAVAGTFLVWFLLPFCFADPRAPLVGFGAGAIAGGALSGDFAELGLLPPGLFLMGLSFLCRGIAPEHSFVFDLLAGCGAGLFLVPLAAFLQLESAAAQRGRVLAANHAAGMFAIAAAALAMRIWPGRVMLPAVGLATLAGSVAALARMRIAFVRFILWATAHLLFRLRLEGLENIPRTGGALLVSNHVSYADAVLVGCLARRRTVHFLMWQPIFDVPVANYFFRMLEAIPIDAASPKGTVRALRAAREELKKGELAGIFPEGSITRTGEVCPFERGFEKLREGSEPPIVPVHIEGLYGHPLSCKGGAAFRSWEKLWRPIVTVRAGAPIRGAVSPAELREAVLRT